MKAPKLLKYEEWENGGRWYCNDTSDFSSVRSKWWAIPRFLQISLDEFVQLLVDKFQVSHITMRNNVLIYCWDDYAKCHAFVLWINKMARQKKFII